MCDELKDRIAFCIWRIIVHTCLLQALLYFVQPLSNSAQDTIGYCCFIFIRSEEHLPTYCRTEEVQFTVSGSINEKIILESPTLNTSFISPCFSLVCTFCLPCEMFLAVRRDAQMAVFAGYQVTSRALKPIQVPSSIKMEWMGSESSVLTSEETLKVT